jgi:hypothetical protein
MVLVSLLGPVLASGVGAIEARAKDCAGFELVGVEFSGLIRVRDAGSS